MLANRCIAMKSIKLVLIAAFAIMSSPAFSCDEECLKEKAEATHNVKFASYLNQKFCDGVAMDFMTSSMRSLENYRSNRIDTKYKGPMKNTRAYVAQRKDWLLECDNYLKLTGIGRIFDNDKTTKEIFALMDSVSKEFSALISGASYSGEDASEVIRDKLDALLTKVDDHKALMHLKGKYVVR